MATQKQIVGYLEKPKKKGRGKRLARVILVVRGKKIVRGQLITDIDKDRKPDRVTFWRRERGSGYVANVSLSSMKKRKAKKKKRKK